MPKRTVPQSDRPAGAKSTWPKPPTRVVRDGDTHKTAYKVFEFWASLPEECSQNAEMRIYRTWPVTDARLAAKEHKHELILRGPIPFQWEEWREELFHQVGSGGYHVYLNEVGVPGSIMESYFTLQDWEKYPPKVDLATLIQGEPKNEAYIEWLRRQGQSLPWDEPEPEIDENQEDEEEDMKAAVDVIERMSEKVVVSAEKRADDLERRLEEVGKRPEVTGRVEGLELISAASKIAIETMAKQDPLANLEKVVALMDARSSGNSETLAFVKIMMDSQSAAQERERSNQREHFEFMKTILTEKAKPDVPLAPAPKGLLEQVREVNDLKELLGTGRRERNPEPKEGGFWEGIGKAIAENPAVLGTAATAMVGIVGAISSAWKGAPAQTVASPTEAIARATGTVVQGQSAPAPAQPTAEELEMGRRVEFCKRVGRALILHLSDKRGLGLNGASFAWWMITEGMPDDTETANGVAFYRHVRAMGYMPFCAMLSPMAEQIKPFGDQFPKFWQEFEQYEQSKKEEENATDE